MFDTHHVLLGDPLGDDHYQTEFGIYGLQNGICCKCWGDVNHRGISPCALLSLQPHTHKGSVMEPLTKSDSLELQLHLQIAPLQHPPFSSSQKGWQIATSLSYFKCQKKKKKLMLILFRSLGIYPNSVTLTSGITWSVPMDGRGEASRFIIVKTLHLSLTLTSNI